MLLDTPAAPHPKALVTQLDLVGGTLLFDWLNAGGVRVDSGGSAARFEGDGLTEPTAAELIEAIGVAAKFVAPPDQAAIWAGQQALGYLDAETRFKLKTTTKAQRDFAAMTTLVMVAMQGGAMNNATGLTIWDFDGAQQTITAGNYLALMLRYGLFCKAMFDDYAP